MRGGGGGGEPFELSHYLHCIPLSPPHKQILFNRVCILRLLKNIDPLVLLETTRPVQRGGTGRKGVMGRRAWDLHVGEWGEG